MRVSRREQDTSSTREYEVLMQSWREDIASALRWTAQVRWGRDSNRCRSSRHHLLRPVHFFLLLLQLTITRISMYPSLHSCIFYWIATELTDAILLHVNVQS